MSAARAWASARFCSLVFLPSAGLGAAAGLLAWAALAGLVALPAAGALSYGHVTPGDVGLTAVPRSSGKLPAYVLKPREYEDVQVMVSRVRTNQPVVLDFQGTRIELAKRILDYSFGFAAGVEGTVRELGDRCFAVLPRAVELTASELDKLEHEGVIRR